jgi:anti-sigma factor RsiW
MSGKLDISDVDLSAFIDGALDVARFRGIEAEIDADPALAERVASLRSDKEMLKLVYAPISDRPIPGEWLALARGLKVPAQRTMSWRLIGAIAAVVLVTTGTLGYWEFRTPYAADVVQAALDARGQVARPERIIAIKAGTNVVQYAVVLSATVASNVKVPDLERLGYRLDGIRLYPNSSGEGAAELLYRDHNDRVFTLYLRRSDGVARFDQFERDGVRVCVWQDEQLSTVMTGNVSTAAMQRLASLAYTGLTL